MMIGEVGRIGVRVGIGMCSFFFFWCLLRCAVFVFLIYLYLVYKLCIRGFASISPFFIYFFLLLY